MPASDSPPPRVPPPPQPPEPPPQKVPPRPEHRPTVVEVTVAELAEREVVVRLADGRPGVVQRSEVDGTVAVGDVLRVAPLARDDARGRVQVSAAWARKLDAWDAAEAALADGSTIRGTVAASVKGGWVVDVGTRAFLPRSLLGSAVPKGDDFVGTEVEVLVTEVDRAADRLVVSRRDAEKRARRAEEKAAWAEVRVGQRRPGRVVAVEDYGAKVDLDPLRGLVHRSELSWGRIGHPSDVVSVGQEVEVLVTEVSRQKRRIGLSMRQVAPHPFDGLEPGPTHAGTVTRVLDYGAFVRLAGTEAEGLVHVSELSPLPGQRADQLVVPGEELRVKVLSVDRERMRLALSVLEAAAEASAPASSGDGPGS